MTAEKITGPIELMATLQVISEIGQPAYELAAYEDWAFIAAGAEGIKAVDLSRPRAPIVRGTRSDIGTVVHVIVRALDEIYALSHNVTRPGDLFYAQGLFVLSWNPSLFRFNERSFLPLNPELEPNLKGETLDLQYPWINVLAKPPGDSSAKLIPVDVFSPAAPRTGKIESLFFEALDGTRRDRLVYMAGGMHGLGLYEIPLPGIPSAPPVQLDTPGDARRLKFHEGLCYLADGLSGLKIVDVRDPSSPFLYVFDKRLPLPVLGEAWDIELEYPNAYVAFGFDGMAVIDISESSSPELLASVGPDRFDEDYDVQAVAGGADEDLVVFLTQQGLLSVAQYPLRTPTPTPDADLNNDGRVDSRDAFLFQQKWQTQYPTPTPTP